MQMDVKHVQGRVPVTILSLQGNLDGSNYLEVIDFARSLYEGGTRDLLVDMSDVGFLSSAGLIALHKMAIIIGGKESLETEDGWQSLHSLEKDMDSGLQEHIKILNPQPRIVKILESTMIDQFIEVFTDQDKAIASF